jgi:integrase
VKLKALKDGVDNWPVIVNVARPIATQTRYEKMRAVSDQVMREVKENGKRVYRRSYLTELLDLIHNTAMRISAAVNVRYNDYQPDATDEHGNKLPYGSLRWRGRKDKMGKEWIIPLNRGAQAAIERVRRDRPGIGDAPMFPSKDDPMEPITRRVAHSWLIKGEKIAELEHLERGAWHAYRRGWATKKKPLPNQVDVAYAGGWSSVQTMQACYQQAEMSAMLEVVTHEAEVREKQA